jgi:general secretion pathway protein E
VDTKLARLLVGLNNLSPDDLRRAESIALAEGQPLHRILIDRGLVDEETVIPALCDALGLPFVADSMQVGPADVNAIARLTLPWLRNRAVLPLLAPADRPQPVLLADPHDQAVMAELAFLLDRQIEPRGATLRTIRSLLADRSLASPVAPSVPAFPDPSLEAAAEDGPVIRFVAEMLAEAVSAGASDLHFESLVSGLAVRMRVNGLLAPLAVDPAIPVAAVFARLKVLARANVAERRLPQDARFSGSFFGRKVDFRVSVLPTQFGESLALRLLDPQALRLGWDRLGFTAEMVTDITRCLERPSGLFLVTGPTGSGKTTTLYTALHHLNSRRTKIITVEDPVEYTLPGIQQVQVQEEIGLTFARILRSILRHDPNVIMVGEIRDPETAEIACRAAQVGRIVLSTLHTRDAQSARMRLVDLGVPDYIVGDVLRGVLAQNLAVVECPDCHSRGCRTCGFSGATARRLEAELLAFT